MAYHLFGDTDVLTAAQMNSIVGDTVPRFASTTARGAALASPVSGQLCWVDGVGLCVYHLGTGWGTIPILPAGGTTGQALAKATGADGDVAWTSVALSVNGLTGVVVLTKTDVGLGSIDNTADAAKPVSTAQAAALALKAPLASPAFTGTPTGLTKTHVGLSNVDDTSDVNKPVSTAQATADGLRVLKAGDTMAGSLTVGANLNVSGGLSVGSAENSQAWNVTFAAVANTKVDVFFGGFAGLIELEITGYLSGEDATGRIRALWSFHANSIGTMSVNAMTTTAVEGAIATRYAVMPIVWDATNARYKITIAHLTALAGGIAVKIRAEGATAALATTFRDSIGISTPYTTDTTVPAANVATLSAGATAAFDATSVVNVEGSTHYRYGASQHRYTDVFAYYTVSAETGSLKITLPKSWSNTQLRIRIVGFDQQALRYWEAVVTGYASSSSSAWTNVGATVSGNPVLRGKIRAGHDGTNLCLLLGETTTVWSTSHQIMVTEVVATYSNPTGWGSGWSAAISASETGIAGIVTADVNQILQGQLQVVSGKGDGGGLLRVGNSLGDAGTSGVPLVNTVRFTGYNNNTRAEIRATDESGSNSGSSVSVWANNAAGTLTERIRFPRDAAALIPTALSVTGDVAASGAITATDVNAPSLRVAGVGLGTWITYTPTLGGSGWAFGNAAVDAAYMRIGNTAWFRILITWGSTSTYGAGEPTLSLPVVAAGSDPWCSGTAGALDSGSGLYTWDATFPTNAVVVPSSRGTSGARSMVNGTTPFTWTTGDQLWINGWYQT